MHRLLLPLLFTAALAPGAGVAQAQDSTCQPIVEQALNDIGTNCDGLERNSACYGYNRVDATFFETMSVDFFSQPADRARLNDIASIHTVPLDPATNEWGVALLNVQANVPGTLPGQAVTFVLIGDGTLENAVPPDEAYLADTHRIDVTAAVNANLRSGPGITTNIVGGVVAGAVLPADAISPDLGWLRVLHNESAAWISRSVLGLVDGLESLPVVDHATHSPMQAFYFRTGVGEPACAEAPPAMLIVQGPENLTVNLSINGADVSLGSTISFTLENPNEMQIWVYDGTARFPSGNVLPAGFTAIAETTDDGVFVGPWTNQRPMTQEELDRFAFLEMIPANLLRYPIDVPTMEEIQALLAAIRAANSPPPATAAPTATGEAPPVDITPTPGGPPPDFDPNDIYVVMDASPRTIMKGQCATVSWNTRNTREVWFEGQPNIGTNSAERCPTETTPYTIEVFYYDGTSSSHTVVIEVVEPSPTPDRRSPNDECTSEGNCDDEGSGVIT